MNQRFRKLEPKLLILGLLQFGLGTACAARYQTRRLVLDYNLAPWGTDLTIHCLLHLLGDIVRQWSPQVIKYNS